MKRRISALESAAQVTDESAASEEDHAPPPAFGKGSHNKKARAGAAKK